MTKTKQKSILLTPEESRGLLDGSVRELWREMKDQPHDEWKPDSYDEIHKTVDGDFPLRNGLPIVVGWGALNRDGDWGICCPYGKPGDVLLGKEDWRWYGRFRDGMAEGGFEYRADWTMRTFHSFPDYSETADAFRMAMDHWNKWRNARYMPAWAVRHHLQITNIEAVEREGVWGWLVGVEETQ